MIGLMSVNMIRSWRVRYRPAMKSAASTFSLASVSLTSNSLSISSAVDWVIRGARLRPCVFGSWFLVVGRILRGFSALTWATDSSSIGLLWLGVF